MNLIWDSRGTILISAIISLIVVAILLIIIKVLPDKFGRIITLLSPIVVVISFIVSCYVASGEWAWR